MKLSKRLEMVASFVEKGSRIADIGTDHAYLPAYLILNGICPSAVASDIGRGPLENAKDTIEKYEVSDKVKAVLSDGLDNICLDEIDTVILSGMGGDLICDILSRADINKLREKHIIAQPQSHSEKVRLFLMKNGFETAKEDICFDSGHIYICMSARFSGKTDYPKYYEYYGELFENKNELVREYFHNITKQMNIKREALKKTGEFEGEVKELSDILNTIGSLTGD